MSNRPQYIVNGVKDNSFTGASSLTETYPPVFPIFPFTSERGIEEPLVFSDTDAYKAMYGDKHRLPGQPFYTHAASAIHNGAFIAKRIVSENAKPATLRVSVELSVYDALAPKHRGVFYSDPTIYPAGQVEFGQAEIVGSFRVGNAVVPPVSDLPLSTTLFPILDMEIYSKGSFGNHFKVKLIPRFEFSKILYSFQIFEKNVLLGETEAFDFLTMSDDYISKKLQETVAVSIDLKIYSIAIGRLKIYKSELTSFLNAITLERTVGAFTVPASNWLISEVDFLTGQTSDDQLSTFTTGGSLGYGGIDPVKPIRFSGGDDGVALTVLQQPDLLDHTRILDIGVNNLFSSPLFNDRLKFPFNAICDTGYSLEIKKQMVKFSQSHKDIVAYITPFRYADFVEVVEPPPPVIVTYSAIASQTTVQEGSSITINFLTTNFGTGTLYWTLNPVSSPFLNSADFSTPLSGSVSMVNDTGSITIGTTADQTTEGNEQFNVQLRITSVSGMVVATSQTVTIEDSSITPPVGVFLNTNPVINQTEITGIEITLTSFSLGAI